MKILIIADIELQKSRISENRYNFLLSLNRNSKDHIKIVGPGMDVYEENMDIRDLIKNVYGSGKPDIIIHYLMGLGEEKGRILVSGLREVNICKVLWIEDFYSPNGFIKIIKRHNFDSVLFSVRNTDIIKKYKHNYPNLRCKYFSHYIDTGVFRDYGEKKEYDILFYGWIDDRYPFRQRLLKLLKEHDDEFKICYVEHPGYVKETAKHTVYGKELAKLINSSYVSICTKGRYDFLLKKYLEVPACNSVICGNIPSDYRNIFRNHVIKIDSKMSNKKIIKILKKRLENKAALVEMGSNFGEFVRSHFNYEIGYKEFLTMTEEILEEYSAERARNALLKKTVWVANAVIPFFKRNMMGQISSIGTEERTWRLSIKIKVLKIRGLLSQLQLTGGSR